MWDHIININLSKLLHTKTKESIKKIKKWKIYIYFIFTRLFKKLKKKKNNYQ